MTLINIIENLETLSDTEEHIELSKKIVSIKDDTLALKKLKDVGIQCASILSSFPGILDISGLKTINPRLASAIAKDRKHGVLLSGLKQIDPESAQELSNIPEKLCLSGLEKITIDVAKELSLFEGNLILNGITEIDSSVARALNSNEIRFTIDNIFLNTKEIDIEIAKLYMNSDFMEGGFELQFNELISITDEAARLILEEENNYFSFNALTSITIDFAKAYSHHDTILLLGLKKINAEIANYLIMGNKHHLLDLSSLEKIDVDTAEVLSRYKGYRIMLNGLKQISLNVACHLSKMESELILSDDIFMNNLTAETLYQQEYINDFYFSFNKDYISDISDSEAEMIAETLIDHNALQYLKYLPDTPGFFSLCEIIAGYSSDFYFENLEILSPQCAKILASNPPINGLHLNCLKELSLDTALELSNCSSALYLREMEIIDTEVSRALSKLKGTTLNLSGLKELTPECASILSSYTGELNLSGLTILNTETARVLSKHQGTLIISDLFESDIAIRNIFQENKKDIIFRNY